MKEIWRDIEGFKDYQVSNFGKVKSLNYNNTRKEGFLKLLKDKDGYYRTGLRKNGKKKMIGVHRLVAFAFPEICGKYFEGAIVNHKNEDKTDNRAENLEWVTVVYNNTYGTRLLKCSKRRRNGKGSIPVLQYDLQGNFIKEFPSRNEVERELGFARQHIGDCCTGKLKTSYNFIWRYK